MFRVLIIFGFLGVLIAGPITMDIPRVERLKGEITIIKNSTCLSNNNPGITPLPLSKTIILPGQIKYTLGNRVTGDRLLAEGTDRHTYPAMQAIELQVSYPSETQGATLTYIEIFVEQSTNDGSGNIIDGGLQKTNVTVILETNRTLCFTYSAAFYGY